MNKQLKKNLSTILQFNIKTFLLIIFFPLHLQAQVRYGHDTVYKFSERILEILQQDSAYMKAAQDFSFIGDYESALTYGNMERQPYGNISREDSLYFASFHPVDAQQYILDKAQEEQIIMINEPHHFPYHRIFTSSLLEGLYKQGFRYFGAETLNYMDSTLLNQRGYPVINSGYYTVEPQYGNLIRKALAKGFTVFAYEAGSQEAFINGRQREIEQARHIQQILEQDPDAKILIHAGYDHIREDSMGGEWGKAMAGRVKEFTGIDPLTINQEVLTERNDPALENPFYRMVEVEKPTVFINSHEKAFAGPKGSNFYDVRLCHPRTKFLFHRPTWMFFENERQSIFVDEKQLNLGFPCLLQAYNSGEDIEQAVPVDIIEIIDEQNYKPLILNKGSYLILIKGPNLTSKQIQLQVK